jgi:hypothetical protein
MTRSINSNFTAVAMEHLSNLDLSICNSECCWTLYYDIKCVVNVVCALMIMSKGSVFMFLVTNC